MNASFDLYMRHISYGAQKIGAMKLSDMVEILCLSEKIRKAKIDKAGKEEEKAGVATMAHRDRHMHALEQNDESKTPW